LQKGLAMPGPFCMRQFTFEYQQQDFSSGSQ